MTSRPHDELNKRHEELAEQARAQEAEKLKAVPEKDTPASGVRFGQVRTTEQTIADEMLREKARRLALGVFENGAEKAVYPSSSADRAVSPTPPMRVHVDRDHEGVFPKAKPEQERVPARQGGILQPTPGGTEHRPSAASRHQQVWDRERAVAEEGKAAEGREPSRKEGPWDRARGVEMTEGKQAALNREATREVTESRQRNPFDREASDKAQRLVNTIAARSKEGRGME